MAKTFRFLFLGLALIAALPPHSSFAAVRAAEVCPVIPFPRAATEGFCVDGPGLECFVGLRGAFLDFSDRVGVSGTSDATAVIFKKGVDDPGNSSGCGVPAASGREGFVLVRLTNFTQPGTMTVTVSRPNLTFGRDVDSFTFEVKRGTFITPQTFTARATVEKTFDLTGSGLTLLKVLHPELGDEVVSRTSTTAQVRLNYQAPGTFRLDERVGFLVAHPDLNNSFGWPFVVVGNPPPPAGGAVTVVRSGTGTGTVTSAPFGINCGVTCASNFAANTNITLTATANATSRFSRWLGDCAANGANPVCNINNAVQPTAAVNAEFLRVTHLTVSVGTNNAGSVTSVPQASSLAPINCGFTCTTDYADPNALVTLNALPAPGHRFVGWSLTTCADASPTCTFTIGTVDRNIIATFQ
jgi:hypothetical protein